MMRRPRAGRGEARLGSMDVRLMPLAALVGACREETGRFLRREPSREEFCFELIRRAIDGGDPAAWQAVYEQYRGVVLAWIRQHPASSATRAAGEDDDYRVNRTFERFWTAVGAERFRLFPGLAATLRYLKMCAHSVLLDEIRARGAVQLDALSERTADLHTVPDAVEAAVGELAGRELWQVISAELGDEAERLVARLCFALDLKPREVYERHPDRFASVDDVYRVKRNLLDRLRRSPEVRRFLEE